MTAASQNPDFVTLVTGKSLPQASDILRQSDAFQDILNQSGLNKKLFKLNKVQELIENPTSYFEEKKKKLKALSENGKMAKQMSELVKKYHNAGLSMKEAIALAKPIIASNIAAESVAIQLEYPTTSSLSDVDQILNRISLNI